MNYIYTLILLFLSLHLSPATLQAAALPQASSTVVKHTFELPVERGKAKKKKKKRKRKLKKSYKNQKKPLISDSGFYALEVVMNIFIILCAVGGYAFFLMTMFISGLSVFWFIGIFGFCIIPLLAIPFYIIPGLYMLPSVIVSSLIFILGGGIANLIIGLVAGIPFLWIMGAVILGLLVLAAIIWIIYMSV